MPNAPTGRDLIVSHIALETDYPHKVLEKLLEFEVPFRQNISVPDPKKARENLVEAFETSEGKITQYFVRDPDGYYLEICNCDILTAFCLFKEKEAEQKPGRIPKYKKLMDAVLGSYVESGQVKPSVFRLPQLFKTGLMAQRWVKRARQELKDFEERVDTALSEVMEAAQPDPEIFQRFVGRQKTYCDVCQGFSKEELAAALCRSGDHAPAALLLSEGGRISQQVMAVSAPAQKDFGSKSVYSSKPFEDADAGPPKRLSVTSQLWSGPSQKSLGQPSPLRGQMLALTFDDPKMQDFLTRSNTFENFVSKNQGLKRQDLEGEEGPLEEFAV